jgi:hypothetical protein
MEWEVPPPADMAALLKALETDAKVAAASASKEAPPMRPR